jgi:hypothetical protein
MVHNTTSHVERAESTEEQNDDVERIWRRDGKAHLGHSPEARINMGGGESPWLKEPSE